MKNYKRLPKTKEYKIQAINEKPNWEANLNMIDTSKITDMSYLFSTVTGLEKFNGNISKWNTSNVKNMSNMFYESNFN